MTKKNSSGLLNDFGSIDYKKPLANQQDMRTSSYLGHKLLNDTTLGRNLQPNCQQTIHCKEDPVLAKSQTSENNANYVWKFGNPEEVRNVLLDRNVNFMKPLYDCSLKFLKRPMRPATSVTHSDYLYQPATPFSTPARYQLPSSVSTTKIFIDRNKPGYSKYLDPTATTTNLDFCYRSPQDVLGGIAAKDAITFWNWKEIESRDKNVYRVKDFQLCDKLPSKECPKRRCEFPSIVKAVPNSGLITEVRENFTTPIVRPLLFNDLHMKTDMSFEACEPAIIGAAKDTTASADKAEEFF